MNHLEALEAEAIYIMREVAAECEKPVMLYSIGKDSHAAFGVEGLCARETALPLYAYRYDLEI